MPKIAHAVLVIAIGGLVAWGLSLAYWLYGPANGKAQADAAQERLAAERRAPRAVHIDLTIHIKKASHD